MTAAFFVVALAVLGGAALVAGLVAGVEVLTGPASFTGPETPAEGDEVSTALRDDDSVRGMQR